MLLMLSSSALTPFHASVASHKADSADFNIVSSVDQRSLFEWVSKEEKLGEKRNKSCEMSSRAAAKFKYNKRKPK